MGLSLPSHPLLAIATSRLPKQTLYGFPRTKPSFLKTDSNPCVSFASCSSSSPTTGLHLLALQITSHGLFDVHVRVTGDLHIDDRHTNEDVALAIGTALLQALGDRKGIHQFGDFSTSLDEALIHVALFLSGRPHLRFDLHLPTQRVGTYDTQVPGVPLIFGIRNSLFLEKPSEAQRGFVKSFEEKRLHMTVAEKKLMKKRTSLML